MAHLPAVTFPGFLRRLFLGTTALLPAAMAQAQAPNAVPTGGQVSAGQATITQSGTQTQVTQGSNRAVVDWQRFDVGRNSSVNFTQPNAQSWTLNRVQTPDPSMIAGRITANGGVAIVNQSGVVFTPGSQVNVGSLIASTANITNQNFMAGRMEFNERGREGARVENHGSITVADRGLAALVGPGAANTGTIRARLGTAVVAGAETFRLDLAGDGMLSLEITESVRRTANGNAALVTNSGVIEAQGGQVILSAHAASGLVESVVRNTGRVAGRNVAVTGQGGNVEIAAGSVTARGGSVSITAPDATVVVGPQARVSASSRQGGGQVQLGGSTTAAVRVEGRVSARGTGANATGGRVAVQARDSVTLAPTAVVNASGTVGGGTVLLGTTGIGRAQTMARETRVESGAVVRVDATASGNGGTIVVNSAESTVMSGTLSARGGSRSGDGGFIEVSAMRNILLNGSILLSAPNGAVGTFLLDPVNIIIRDGAAGAGEDAVAVPGAGDFNFNANTGGNLDAVITTAQLDASGGNIVLQAQNDISVLGAVNKAAGNLTLIADTGTITISAGLTLGAGLLTVTATAGAITTTANVSGVGVTMNAGLGITLGGTVSGNAGAVNISAGGNLAVNQAVSSTGGAVNLTSTGGSFIQGAGGTVTAAGQIITVRADTMTIAAALNAGAGGTVVLQRQSAGSISIGAGGDTALAAADLQTHVTAGTLRLAATGTATVAENFVSPATTLDLNGAGGASVDVGVTVSGLTLLRNQSGSLTNSGTITTTAGSVQASTALSNLGTGIITGSATAGTGLTNAGSITGNATATNGLLDNQAGGSIGGNAVSTAAAVNNAGTITGTVTAQTDVTNTATGTINGATITATTGNVLNAGAMTPAAPLTITAGGNITQNGTLNAGANAVNLNAGGAISGSGGVTGTTLTVRGAAGGSTSRAGSLNLTTGNAIATLDARTNNAALTFAQVAALSVTQADAGTGAVTLGSDGAITGGGVVGGTFTVRGAGLGTTRAGGLDLTTGNTIATLDARTNNAALTFAQAGALSVTQADAGTGAVTLSTTGATSLTISGAVTGGIINLTGGQDLLVNALVTGTDLATLGATAGDITTTANISAVGVTMNAGGAITLGGTVAGNAGAVNATASTAMNVNAAVSSGGAGVSLTSATFTQTAGGTVTTTAAGQTITVRADTMTIAAALNAGATGTVALRRNTAGSVSIGAGGDTAHAATDLQTHVTAQTLRLVASTTVTVAEAFVAPAGMTTLALDGVGGVTVNAPVTVGLVLADAGSLINNSTINGSVTALTDVTNEGSGTINGTAITATNGNVLNQGSITSAAPLTITAGGNITLNGTQNAGANAVNLNAGGTISGTAGVVGTTLTVRGANGTLTSRAGSLNLTTGNTIATLDARTNNADLIFGQVGALAITQADAGTGNVTLRSDGAITRSAGVTTGVVGSLLIVRGATGDAATRAASLNLTEGTVTAGNAITTLDARTNNADLIFGQVGALAITQADAGTGNVTLRSDGAITRSAGVTTGVVGSVLSVRGATGDAATRAASLNLTEGTVTAGNAITTLDARTNNADLIFGQVGALAITQADAGTGNVTLRSDGAITRSAGVTTGVVGSLLSVRGATGDAATRAASLNLTEGTVTAGNAITTLDARTNNADLIFGQVGALAITQADAGTGNVTLRSDGAITRSAGVTTGVVGSVLSVRGATGDAATRAASLNLTEGTVTAGNAITTLDARTNNAELIFGQVGALAITQADAGTGNVTLRSDGAITRSAGVTTGVVGSVLSVRGATGDAATRAASLNLTEGTVTAGNAITTLDARTNNADLIFGQVGALAITQADAGTANVTLRSDGAITRSAGVTTGVVGSVLSVRGATGDAATRAASLNLTEGTVTAGNAITTLDARTNNADLIFGQVGALAITQADAGTGNVTLRSDGAITRSAGVTTGVVGSVLSVRGATGDAATRAASLNLTEGTVTAGNAITTLDARTNNADLIFGQVGALAITQADAGTGNVTLRSDGAITRSAGVTTGVVGSLLSVRGATGDAATRAASLNLTEGTVTAGNAITTLDARTNNADLIFGQVGALAITQADAGTGNVTLRSDGAITRSAGVTTGVVGSLLSVRGATGDAATRAASLNLTEGTVTAGNAITTLDARTNNADLIFGQVGALAITQADAGTGNVTLRSDGAITRSAGVTTGVVGSLLSVRGATGDAATRAASLNLTEGTVTAGNAITTLDARTNNADLIFGQVGALAITQADAGTGNVTLRSDGAITRSAGVTTGVVGSLLSVRGATGDAATRAASLNLTEGTVTAGNAITTLDARTNNADLIFGQVGALAITQADAGTGNVTLRSDGAITRSAGVTTGVVGSVLSVRGATGDAATRAASLNLTEGTVTAGNAITTLDARTNNAELIFGQVGALAITQADAGTGNVTLRSDGAITRSAGVTTGVVGSVLSVRGATGDAATRAASLNLTEGTVTAGNAITTLDARTNNAELIFGQVGALAITQADAGTGNVTLRSDGAITGMAVRGVSLTVRGAAGGTSRAGSLNLNTGNAITSLDARTNNAALTFAQTGALAITQADAGTGAVTLGSDGAITGNNVIGSSLTVRGAGLAATRAASLDLTGNAINSLDALVNNAALTFGQVNGFSVTQANAGTGNVALLSDGAITGTGGVTATTLTLRGAVGGTSRAGSVNLTTGNAITNLDARTSGALTFAQVGGIILTQLDTGTGNATLRSDGAISNTGAVNTALLAVRGAAGGNTPAESLTLTGANNIGALDVLVRGALGLSLASGTSIQQLGSSAGSVQITANGTLAVTGPATAALDMTLRTTSGDISIVPGGTLSGGRATTLTAAGDILQAGGTLSAGTALTIAAGQDAIMTGGITSAASLGTSTQGVSAGRDFLWNGGSVTLPTIHAVTAGRDLGLRTTGGATTVLGNLTAGRNLAVETTAGALTLQGNTVRASGGTLDLRAAGNLGVFDANLAASGVMTLRATGSLSSNPSAFTAESISLISGAGLSFTQGTLNATQNLTAEVTGDITFQNSSLRASTAPADNPAAFRVLRLVATGNLALRNSSVTADRVEFVAGGTMTTAGSGFNLGTGLLLSARSGVGQANEALTTVAALDNSRLPLVIYDTRSGIFLTKLPDLLTSATTDQPSRTFNAQTWQVPQVTSTASQLLFGVNDGAPTPPTNAVAGAVQINMNAGSSPVFMLLNGGTASGFITAARLGVYGLPGSAPLPDGRTLNLTGTLGGIGGEGAARFGILGSATGTQPSPFALDLYRFNNCVISSVNCVVPTFLQLPTIPLINSVILGIQQPGFDDRDVLLPNVAEKDF